MDNTDPIISTGVAEKMLDLLETIAKNSIPLNPEKLIQIPAAQQGLSLNRLRLRVSKFWIANPTAGALAVTIKLGQMPIGPFQIPTRDTKQFDIPFTVDRGIPITIDQAVDVFLMAEVEE